MNNGKSNMMKRMMIAAVCVGMVGSGGLVQAMNTAKPIVKPLKTGKITPVMTKMIDVPASNITHMPSGLKVESRWKHQPTYNLNKNQDRIVSVNQANFQIGKAEVTGALWSEVYNWAIKNGYKFANTGANVGTDKPVTDISWYDAIVWTNAYSEKSKLQPVYQGEVFLGLGKQVLKDATDRKALDRAQIVLSKEKDKRGYQLPTALQFELAARFLGTTKPKEPTTGGNRIVIESNPQAFFGENDPSKGILAREVIATKGKDNKTYYWTPANYASGANYDVQNKQETLRVAWFHEKNLKTVCTKATNVLKICDMSGNVEEWVYDRRDDDQNIIMGGNRYKSDDYYKDYGLYYYNYNSRPRENMISDVGFRLARNVP